MIDIKIKNQFISVKSVEQIIIR